jgi:hypothetical protein
MDTSSLQANMDDLSLLTDLLPLDLNSRLHAHPEYDQVGCALKVLKIERFRARLRQNTSFSPPGPSLLYGPMLLRVTIKQTHIFLSYSKHLFRVFMKKSSPPLHYYETTSKTWAFSKTTLLHRAIPVSFKNFRVRSRSSDETKLLLGRAMFYQMSHRCDSENPIFALTI